MVALTKAQAKALKIKESLKATQEKRKSQVCLVRELKINTARMNQTEIEMVCT